MMLAALLVAASCSTQKAAQGSRAGDGNTNATKTLKVSEKDTRSYSNIYDYLRGKVPGLQINGTEIYIRGINSVNAQGEPLILVDGVEMHDIGNLNPMDIESVEIIKDSAAALYGFRGVNGVIKITTKTGSSEEPVE